METIGLGTGSYIEPSTAKETKKVKVICSFITYVEVPEDLENYSEIKEYIENVYDEYDLRENSEKILIEDIEK